MNYLVHNGRLGHKWGIKNAKTRSSIVSVYDLKLSDMYSEELYHYGTPEHSGRYPWGSGDRPFQRIGESLKLKEQQRYYKKETKKIQKNAKLRYKAIKKGKRTLTDKELRDMIDRLKLERELDSLLKENIQPARSITDKVISNIGTDTLGKFGKKASYWTIAYIIESASEKKSRDFPTLSEYMMRKDK